MAMSITLSALSSSAPLIKRTHITSSPVASNRILAFPSSIKPFKLQETHAFSIANKCRFLRNGFIAKAENSGGENQNIVKNDARGESTMPDRFKYMAIEAPDKPVRWPWFIALTFLVYAWRSVLWELSNWKKAVDAVCRFVCYISKLALAIIYHLIGDQITGVIRVMESTVYSIRGLYSGVIAYAPVQELTTIIILASCVFAIGEAAVPDCVKSQPYVVTAAGIMGFAAVRGYISELLFWILLSGLFVFARVMRKRDYVSAALPVAAVLAAVGEPWVRVVVMVSYAALAVGQHSKMPLRKSEGETNSAVRKVPFPLICAAFAIGVRLAAKWAGYRHLTWMIV